MYRVIDCLETCSAFRISARWAQNSPEGFSVISGDDNITLDLIKSGGHGVISVASNAVPKKMSDMVSAALGGDMTKAENIHNELSEFFETEFIETNPIPIKYMLFLMGKCKDVYRLPMCELSNDNKFKTKSFMEKSQLV